MTTAEIIRNRMNRAMSSKGKTFIWNPRSKFNVNRKIKIHNTKRFHTPQGRFNSKQPTCLTRKWMEKS